MKTLKFSLFAAAVFFITHATAQEAPVAKPMGLTFTEDTHNFGDIDKDKPVSHEFTFKNTSAETILITGVKPSCGCTATNYTKTPVKPGETGSVTATYNAHNPGPFTKTLTVSTNDTEQTKVLYIKGKVIAPDTPAVAAAPAAAATPKATRAKATPAATVAKTHTVAQGESLSILAGKYYGDVKKYDIIYQANKDIISDAKVIEPGQVLKIPAVPAKAK
jgi:LysM repeat protein